MPANKYAAVKVDGTIIRAYKIQVGAAEEIIDCNELDDETFDGLMVNLHSGRKLIRENGKLKVKDKDLPV